jgi:hypothetical protein
VAKDKGLIMLTDLTKSDTPLYNHIEVSVCTLVNTKQDGTGRTPLGHWRP